MSKHIAKTGRWTYCRLRIGTEAGAMVKSQAGLRIQEMKKRGRDPEEKFCSTCYRRWKNDSLRGS